MFYNEDKETIKYIYIDDWFANWVFEDDIRDRGIDLSRNLKLEALENLGDWLPISYITNWKEIKSFLNKVSVESIKKERVNSTLTSQWWAEIKKNQLLGDYFESQGEIDWQGGCQSTFGQYTFELEYESNKEQRK
tara:strand:- start:1 stop:405 length:405 start_codon:yes stop_codon:yes gene_type:complete